MSIVKGLKNIETLLEKPKYENDGPKVKFNCSVYIFFWSSNPIKQTKMGMDM